MADRQERRFGELTLRIERGRCIASASCVAVRPEVLELGTDGVITFVDEPEEADRQDLIEACEVCPVDALILLDSEGQQIAPV